MSVPIFEGDRVVATVGVANKREPYEATDTRQLELFVASMWEILQRRRAEERLRRSLAKLRVMLGGTIQAIIRAVESRDPYTAGHQKRVADLARAIAVELQLSPAAVDAVRLAGMLHDIGKIAIPADILTKPARLSAVQFALIKQHSVLGAEILETIAYPPNLHRVVRQHHERLDGTGYPDRLEGDAICQEARILAVADSMEAMVSHRPYRPARPIEDALVVLERQRGRTLDIDAVDACVRLFREGRFSFD